MTKAFDIIKRSFDILAIIADGEAPTNSEVKSALTVLNGIMSGLLSKSTAPHVEYTSNSALTTDVIYNEDLAQFLAEKIASSYGKQYSSAGAYGRLSVGIRGVNDAKFDLAQVFKTDGIE